MSVWEKLFSKITFKNYPDTSTPINAVNLNKMTDAIDGIDDRVVELNSNLADSIIVKTVSATIEGGMEAYGAQGITYDIPSVKGYEPFLAMGSATNVAYVICQSISQKLASTATSFDLYYMNIGVAFTSDYITTANILYRRKIG